MERPKFCRAKIFKKKRERRKCNNTQHINYAEKEQTDLEGNDSCKNVFANSVKTRRVDVAADTFI